MKGDTLIKQIEGNILLISFSVTLGILGLLTAWGFLAVSSIHILGISVFTTIYALSDLPNLTIPKTSRARRRNRKVVIWTKFSAMPLAFVTTFYYVSTGMLEEEATRLSNAYTLIALCILLLSIASKSIYSMNEKENISGEPHRESSGDSSNESLK